MITKEKLKKALRTSTRWKLDECEDYNLNGTLGRVFYDTNNWYTYFPKCRKGEMKLKLSFMEVSQEGDIEIIFKSNNLPTSEQATIVRNAVGLRTKKTYSPETLQKMRDNLQKARLKTLVARGSQ